MTTDVLEIVMAARKTLGAEKATTGTRTGSGARVILFNDDVHTFEEVAGQLVKAVRCTYARGIALANTVHQLGSAVVYEGHFERCEAVAGVLAEIGLKTAIER
jgi:ATP-dependent Clp protease adaptor protein ClpS